MQEDPFFAGQRGLFGLMLEKGMKLEQTVAVWEPATISGQLPLYTMSEFHYNM